VVPPVRWLLACSSERRTSGEAVFYYASMMRGNRPTSSRPTSTTASGHGDDALHRRRARPRRLRRDRLAHRLSRRPPARSMRHPTSAGRSSES
jgi:hypothetical protein